MQTPAQSSTKEATESVVNNTGFNFHKNDGWEWNKKLQTQPNISHGNESKNLYRVRDKNS